MGIKRLAEISLSTPLMDSDLKRLNDLFFVLKEEQVTQVRKPLKARSQRLPVISRLVQIASLALKLNRFRCEVLRNGNSMTRNKAVEMDRCMAHLKVELSVLGLGPEVQQTKMGAGASARNATDATCERSPSVITRDSAKMTMLYELCRKVLLAGITAEEANELNATSSFYNGKMHQLRSNRHRYLEYFSIISRAVQISKLALKVHGMRRVATDSDSIELTRYKQHLRFEIERFASEYGKVDELNPQQQQQQQQKPPASARVNSNDADMSMMSLFGDCSRKTLQSSMSSFECRQLKNGLKQIKKEHNICTQETSSSSVSTGSLNKLKMFGRAIQLGDTTLKLHELRSKMTSGLTAEESTQCVTLSERLHRVNDLFQSMLNSEGKPSEKSALGVTRHSDLPPSLAPVDVHVQVPIFNESSDDAIFSLFRQLSDQLTNGPLSVNQVAELEKIVKASKLRLTEMRENNTKTTQMMQLSSRLLHENELVRRQSGKNSDREEMQQLDQIELEDQLPSIDEIDQRRTRASSMSSIFGTTTDRLVETHFLQEIHKLTDQLNELNSKIDRTNIIRSTSEIVDSTLIHLIIPTFHASIASEIFALLHYMRERQSSAILSHAEILRLEQLVAQTENHAKRLHSDRLASGSKTVEWENEYAVTSRIQYIASMMVNLQHLLMQQQRCDVSLSDTANLLLSTYTRLLDEQFSKPITTLTDSDDSNSPERRSSTDLSISSENSAQNQPAIKRIFNTNDKHSIFETLHNLSRKLLTDDLSGTEIWEIVAFRNNVEYRLNRHSLRPPKDSVASQIERVATSRLLQHATLILNTKALLDKKRESSLTGSEHLELNAYTEQLKNQLKNGESARSPQKIEIVDRIYELAMKQNTGTFTESDMVELQQFNADTTIVGVLKEIIDLVMRMRVNYGNLSNDEKSVFWKCHSQLKNLIELRSA